MRKKIRSLGRHGGNTAVQSHSLRCCASTKFRCCCSSLAASLSSLLYSVNRHHREKKKLNHTLVPSTTRCAGCAWCMLAVITTAVLGVYAAKQSATPLYDTVRVAVNSVEPKNQCPLSYRAFYSITKIQLL